MADQVASLPAEQGLLRREVDRRNFLKGATTQVVKHSLITAPAVSLVLSGIAIPVQAQSYQSICFLDPLVIYGNPPPSPDAPRSIWESFLKALENIFARRRAICTPGSSGGGIRG